MRLWHAIRRPIGLTLMTALIWAAIITAHAIPEIVVQTLIGG